MIVFIRSIGRGHSALENFLLFLNSPALMTANNYKKMLKKTHVASKQTALESMLAAASELIEESAIQTAGVSLDGMWQKQGFASHHGVVTCISVDSGKCLDAEVFSNICKACNTWSKKDPNSEEYPK